MPKKKAKLPLSKTHPELATEADGWDPEKITAGTGKKLSWRCKLNHTWETTPSHRLRGQGCPYCGNRKVLVGFNDLVSTNPEIAKEADGWNPKNFTAGSHKPMDWVCQKVTSGKLQFNIVRGEEQIALLVWGRKLKSDSMI